MMTSLQEKLLFNRKYSWILHVAFWIFVYLDILVDVEYISENWTEVLLGILIDISIVYFNLYVLFPKLLLKKRYFLYALASLMCVGLMIFMNELISEPFDNDVTRTDKFIYIIEILVLNGVVLGSAIGLKLFKTFVKDKIRLDELANLKAQEELENLKNQINPHFLFNTMNSLYVMAQKHDERLPETILDLSDLMRFQLHKGDKHSIMLSEEFGFIKNYVKFEKLRRDDLDIDIAENIKDPSVHVPPLILLCFVENAMKHSRFMDNTKNTVKLTVESDDNRITFNVFNTKGDFEKRLNSPDKGIGEKNVRRRLDIIYDTEYTLEVNDLENTYEVTLSIPTTIPDETY